MRTEGLIGHEPNTGESDVRVNFGDVTFFSGDHLYADNTGIIRSEDALDIEEKKPGSSDAYPAISVQSRQN